MPKAMYTGVNGLARKVKKMYVGVTNTIFEGESENWGREFEFGYGCANLATGKTYSVKINDTTYTGFAATFYAGDGWYLSNGTITINIETPLQGQDGTVYLYDTNGRFDDVSNMSLQIIEGAENIARKVKKGYIGIGGVAKLFFSSDQKLVKYGTVTALSQARGHMAAASIGDYALFMGGGNTSSARSAYYRTVDAYSSSLSRTTPSDVGSSRVDAIATATPYYAYVAGGWMHDGEDYTYHTTVYAYNPSLVRSSAASLSDYAINTEAAAGSVDQYAVFFSYEGFVEAIGKSLTKTSLTFPFRREGIAAASVGNYVIFAGGRLISGDDYAYYSDAFAYNSSLVKTTATSLSVARSDMAAATLNDTYAMFIGGYNSSGNNYTVDTYTASLVKGTATNAAGAIGSVIEPGVAASVGPFVIAIGDYPSTASVYNASLTLSTISSPFSATRYAFSAASVGDYALFAGGVNTVTSQNIVDAFLLTDA